MIQGNVTRPAPMVPAEADLRDFAFLPLDVLRLRDSDLACVEDAEVFRAAVLSWCVAWHQVPAASLPDDDAVLARLLGYGRDVKAWRRVRAAGGLRGWVLCDDGRMYHPVVSDKARGAWASKLAQRARTEAARTARAAARQTGSRALSQSRAASVTDTVADSVTASKGQGEGEGINTQHAPPPGARAVCDDPPEAHGMPPTPAGMVCRALREVGVERTNPGDARLQALLAQGATVDEFIGLGAEALAKRVHDPFAWVLVVLPKRRAEAGGLLLQGSPVAPAGPHVGAITVPSDDAQRTQDMLAARAMTPDEQAAARVAAAQAVERMAKLRAELGRGAAA